MGWLDKVENQRIEEEKKVALWKLEQDKQAIIKDAEIERKRLEFMESKARYDATVEALMPAMKDIATIAEITAERARRLGIQVWGRYYEFTEVSKYYPFPNEMTYRQVQLYNSYYRPDNPDRMELSNRDVNIAGEAAVDIGVGADLSFRLVYHWCPVPDGKSAGDEVNRKFSEMVYAKSEIEDLTPDRIELLFKWVHRPHRLDIFGKETYASVKKQPMSYRAGRWLKGVLKG